MWGGVKKTIKTIMMPSINSINLFALLLPLIFFFNIAKEKYKGVRSALSIAEGAALIIFRKFLIGFVSNKFETPFKELKRKLKNVGILGEPDFEWYRKFICDAKLVPSFVSNKFETPFKELTELPKLTNKPCSLVAL